MSARHRGNGEGTILKRSDGRWAAAIVLDDYSRKWMNVTSPISRGP